MSSYSMNQNVKEGSMDATSDFVDVPVAGPDFSQEPASDRNTTDNVGSASPVEPASLEMSHVERERRASNEWDASKVPPSRFQKRRGSIYAVPSSRDGHVGRNNAAQFHQKHAEMTSARRW